MTFRFIYVILKYIMFIEKRKLIIVAAQNVTLRTKLFFFQNCRERKNAFESLRCLGSMGITDVRKML